eukprot:TRINITY_DN7231_c0_g1_i1.p1 TRINITY_DN7231_c0_g1~~TRINITY_DN7231_c0_g1_i1.p1  ORF type:complete len:417 (-),score=45.74 TRINITY_DN7231_c0_g1_i1:189-1439(-)
MEIENYVNCYSGYGKLRRLLFALQRAREKGESGVENDVLCILLTELRSSRNTGLYKEIFGSGDVGGSRYDEEWVSKTDEQAGFEEAQLLQDLAGSQTNLIKESIRQSHQLLGDFYCQRGELQKALKSYSRSRDYCTTTAHTLDTCLRIIKVSLQLDYYPQCSSFCERALQIIGEEGDKVVALSKVQAARGLVALEREDYAEAGLRFCDVKFEMEDQFNEVVSGQDVACIAIICGLASFSRSQVEKLLLQNGHLKQFLELVPDVRQLAFDYFHGRYQALFVGLQNVSKWLQEDMYLCKHIAKLCDEIRNRSLIQYTQPYISVKLDTMALAFNSQVPEIEAFLTKLIRDGKIIARIDSQSKIMYARHQDVKNASFKTALKTANKFFVQSRAILIRANLLKYGLIQGPEQQGYYQSKDM